LAHDAGHQRVYVSRIFEVNGLVPFAGIDINSYAEETIHDT
jgi:hypothetical protein